MTHRDYNILQQKMQALWTCIFLLLTLHFIVGKFHTCGMTGTIQFIDLETKRGIPLVSITTTNDVTYISDSNGVISLNEPGWTDQSIWFRVNTDGYELVDGDEFQGATVILSCQVVVLKMKRKQLAERLYRVTGQGIYRDSFLSGQPVPFISQDVIREFFLTNAKIMGQDSVMNVVYKGRYYWFFGDTNCQSRYLGNFYASGAFSNFEKLKTVGLMISPNLTYFTQSEGFVKGMAPVPPLDLPTWLHAVHVRKNQSKEEMFATYMKPDHDMNIVKRGILKWNDQLEQFESFMMIDFSKYFSYPIDGSHLVHLNKDDGMIYFGQPYPIVRTSNYLDLDAYQSFTPLKAGTSNANLSSIQLDYNEKGQLVYDWKFNTSPLSAEQMFNLVMSGKMKQQDAYLLQLRSHQDGSLVIAHAGSVNYNPYRNRYVMIVEQFVGKEAPSTLGEVWYAEGVSPIGPFVYATKIATHKGQDFYNPSHHWELDEDGGRVIYFEGTFSNFWTSSSPIPRYNYNQLMYRLDIERVLSEHPVPVFKDLESDMFSLQFKGSFDNRRYEVQFYAHGSPCTDCVPIYQRCERFENNRQCVFTLKPSTHETPLFYAKLSKGVSLLSIHQVITTVEGANFIVFSVQF